MVLCSAVELVGLFDVMGGNEVGTLVVTTDLVIGMIVLLGFRGTKLVTTFVGDASCFNDEDDILAVTGFEGIAELPEGLTKEVLG